MSKFTNEPEFNKKLQEISDAYESVKTALWDLHPTSSKYDYAFESLRKLRDYAATGLKSGHEIKES